jgi:hypothetical protein
MEIHPPEAPVHSFRDFLVHLLMISLGVLIALGAEGLVEHVHNRHVVAEARANLLAEMRENQRTLEKNLPQLKHNEELLEQSVSDVQKLKSNRKAKAGDVDLNLNFFSLSDTSWRTAEATGALALMRYQEVQNFAEYYNVQSALNHLMGSLEDTWLDLIAAYYQLGNDPAKVGDRELDEVQRRAQLSLGRLRAVENIGRSLDVFYNKKLKPE